MGEREEAEEASRWEYAIDVDDSDLLPLLIPCTSSSSNPQTVSSLPSLRPCSQLSPSPSQILAPLPSPPPPSIPRSVEEPLAAAPRLIPGPAGSVQAAMRRQSATANRDGPFSGDQRMDGLGLDLDEEDGDFKLNPWLCALEFLGEDFDLVWPIASIKTRATERVPQVVGIVKSCTPNGLGNLFLTLKDPTGSVGASIHHSVLSDCNLGGVISVGCVLVLKQVVAFCPALSICYLNVTSKNVVKLIKKDCGSPHKQILPSFTTRVCTTRAAGRSDSEHMEAELHSVAGERAVRLRTNAQEEVSKSLNCQRTIDGGDRSLSGSLPFGMITKTATRLVSSVPGNFLASDMEVEVRQAAEPLALHVPYADNEERSLNSGRMIDNSKTDIGTSVQSDRTMYEKSKKVNEAKKVISEVSVVQWTDEQLLELFSDYPDEVDGVQSSLNCKFLCRMRSQLPCRRRCRLKCKIVSGFSLLQIMRIFMLLISRSYYEEVLGD